MSESLCRDCKDLEKRDTVVVVQHLTYFGRDCVGSRSKTIPMLPSSTTLLELELLHQITVGYRQENMRRISTLEFGLKHHFQLELQPSWCLMLTPTSSNHPSVVRKIWTIQAGSASYRQVNKKNKQTIKRGQCKLMWRLLADGKSPLTVFFNQPKDKGNDFVLHFYFHEHCS